MGFPFQNPFLQGKAWLHLLSLPYRCVSALWCVWSGYWHVVGICWLSRWRIHAGSPPSARKPGVKTTERIRIASTTTPNGILHAAIRICPDLRDSRPESWSENVSAASGKASTSRHFYHLFFTEILFLFLLCSLRSVVYFVNHFTKRLSSHAPKSPSPANTLSLSKFP